MITSPPLRRGVAFVPSQVLTLAPITPSPYAAPRMNSIIPQTLWTRVSLPDGRSFHFVDESRAKRFHDQHTGSTIDPDKHDVFSMPLPDSTRREYFRQALKEAMHAMMEARNRLDCPCIAQTVENGRFQLVYLHKTTFRNPAGIMVEMVDVLPLNKPQRFHAHLATLLTYKLPLWRAATFVPRLTPNSRDLDFVDWYRAPTRDVAASLMFADHAANGIPDNATFDLREATPDEYRLTE